MVARLGELTDAAATDTAEGDGAVDAGRVDQIALLERVQAAAAAAQAAVSVRFARSQVATQQRQMLRDPRAVGRGIADQLALACRVPPSEGSRRLGIARALYAELPATAGLLREGRISFYVAGLVVFETRHLDPERRRGVDAQLAGELGGCAPRQAAALARKLAYAADPEGFVARGRTASDRRVGLRPAPDTMSVLSGFLPVEQGVACWAALRAYTNTVKGAGDSRTRDQIMADTLVERITGQARAGDMQAEVAIVMPVEALTGPANSGTGSVRGAESGAPDGGGVRAGSGGVTSGVVAEVLGYGPIPLPLAREILADSRGRRWWRRLFTAPHGGVIGGDPSRRCFDGTLATLIGYRDGGRCREPFCAAPARHTDHIVAHRAVERPRSATVAPAVCVPTRYGRCPAGRSGSCTTGAASSRTRSSASPRPGTPTPAEPGPISCTGAIGLHPLSDQTGVKG